ncbi:MAG: chemotaxis protein CheC [Clostridiales bacterium]|nr:chemotaxis protein CheC [Clostridiales bacterium]
MVASYEDLNELQLDAIREVASIGAGNAATALSSLLSQQVKIDVPNVTLMEYSSAIEILGGPETIACGIMVRLSGDMNGIILYLQELDFINVVLKSVFNKTVDRYDELGEMETSALIEIGNIGISSYINSLAAFARMDVQLSVPAFCINMAGAMITVPMTEIGYESNKIMLLDGNFKCGGQKVSSKLLLVPDVQSLSALLARLGVNK